MNPIQQRLDALVRFAERDRFLIGASLFRVVAGATMLLEYLAVYKQRGFFYGPNGIEPFADFVAAKGHLSLYSLSASEWWFQLVYHAGALAAFLWMIGWKTRWMTLANLFLWRSLQERVDGLWDGGDNLLQLVLVYAVFANLGAHFSMDAGAARSPSPLGKSIRAIAHSAAILMIAVQLSLVYGVAGLTKVQGETWRNGTALYYAMKSGEFTWPGMSAVVYENKYLVTLFSYATVAFQISFTFFLFLNRVTRVLAVLMGIAFHLGIMSFMGLFTFGAFMMSVDLSLIDDDEYRWLGARIRHAWEALRTRGSGVRESRRSSL